MLAGALALLFLGSSAMKLLPGRAGAEAAGIKWVEPYPHQAVRALGVAEVAAAVGLVLPGITHVAPVLVPVTAICLAVLMVGAALTHARLREPAHVAVTVVLFALSVFLAWQRLGPHPFA